MKLWDLSRIIIVVVLPVALSAIAAAQLVQPITTKDGKLTLKFGKQWVEANPRSPAFKKLMADLAKTNPQMKVSIESASASLDRMVFDGNDDSKDGFWDNCNVVVRPLAELGGMSFEKLIPAMQSQMPPGTKLDYKVVTLPIGKALTYSGNLPIKVDPKTTKTTNMLGYLIKGSKNYYVITFSTGPGQLVKKRAGYDAIVKAATLRS